MTPKAGKVQKDKNLKEYRKKTGKNKYMHQTSKPTVSSFTNCPNVRLLNYPAGKLQLLFLQRILL